MWKETSLTVLWFKYMTAERLKTGTHGHLDTCVCFTAGQGEKSCNGQAAPELLRGAMKSGGRAEKVALIFWKLWRGS